MPSARVSVANTTLTRPSLNSSSTTSLNVGSMPAWWDGDAPRRALAELVVAEDVQVVVGQVRARGVDGRGDLGPLVGRRERDPGVHDLLNGSVAAGSAEHEDDRRQQTLGVELLDELDRDRVCGAGCAAGGRPWAAVPLPSATAGRPRGPCRSSCRLTWPLSPARVRSPSSNSGNRRRPTSTCWCSGTGRRSSTIVVGAAADLGEPGAELLGVGDRGRQRDDGHRLGQADDDFLPHGAAEAVGEVVHLVHHDEAEPGAACGSRRTACCAAPRWS